MINVAIDGPAGAGKSTVARAAAKELGFISEVIECDERVLSYLDKYKDKQSEVLQAYKSMLVRKWMQTNLEERMMEEIKLCAKLWEKEEHMLAVKQFRERKK